MNENIVDPNFATLCEELSGIPSISNRHLRSMFVRFCRFYGADKIDKLIAEFMTHGLNDLKKLPQFKIAQQLTYCLYTGELLAEQKKNKSFTIEPVEDYFEGLIWAVIQAHPKGISGGYYGHWRYPPEDMISE